MAGVVPVLLSGLLQVSPTSALALTEEMCIADDPDGQVVFGRLFNNVAVGKDSSVFIVGDLAPQVLRFSRNGTLLHAFGRRGSGPGEFQRPAEIALPGDALWVYDIQLRRASLFDVEGEFLRVSAGSDLLGRLGPGFVAKGALADGRLVGAASMHLGRTGGSGRVAVVAVSPGDDGGPPDIDTLALVFEVDRRFAVELPGGPSLVTRSEIDRSSLWMVDRAGNGVVVVDQPVDPDVQRDAFVVRRIEASGREAYRRTFQFDPMEVTAEVREGLVNQLSSVLWEGLDGAGLTQSALERALADAMPLPAELPPITGLVGGRDGAVWLRRELVDSESIRWEVVSASGDRLGAATLSGNVDLRWADRHDAWGVKRDSFDVPSLCRFRVEPVS